MLAEVARLMFAAFGEWNIGQPGVLARLRPGCLAVADNGNLGQKFGSHSPSSGRQRLYERFTAWQGREARRLRVASGTQGPCDSPVGPSATPLQPTLPCRRAGYSEIAC